MPPYLTSLGATQTIIGFLTTGCIICSLFSHHIVVSISVYFNYCVESSKTFQNNLSNIKGKKFSLFLVLTSTLISYVLVFTSTSKWMTILARYLYSNESNSCKVFLKIRIFSSNKPITIFI